LPRDHALAWTPYAWLIYLPVLFVQPVLRGSSALGWILLATGVAAFVVSYFRSHWVTGERLRFHIFVQAALGLAFSPFNTGAYVLFTYAASAGARAERTRDGVYWIAAITALGLLVAYGTGAPFYFWIGHGVFTPLIGAVALHRTQTDRANEQLRAAHAEIERLAMVAERERIARDLHDVPGHTLSLIVLKSELASKLAERNPERAVSEIRDVESISRQALKEVREAIRGYRARLDDELIRARRMLGLRGVEVSVDAWLAPSDLEGNSAIEETLALVLREAVTNVARHSRARHTNIRLSRDPAADDAIFTIEDDGIGIARGGEGLGLRGMRERIDALDGRMTIESSEPGTRITVALPYPRAVVVERTQAIVA